MIRTPTLAPIETCYRGDRFRSRPEARWAVFFDTAGIRYEYEKNSASPRLVRAYRAALSARFEHGEAP